MSIMARYAKVAEADEALPIMVCVVPSPLPPFDNATEYRPHITLWMGPDDDEMTDPQEQGSLMGSVAETCEYSSPLEGKYAGFSVFSPDGDSTLVLSIDCIGLSELQHNIEVWLEDLGYFNTSTHGFNPHLTLQYDWDPEDGFPEWPAAANAGFSINQVFVCFGDLWIPIPLGKVEETDDLGPDSDGSDL